MAFMVASATAVFRHAIWVAVSGASWSSAATSSMACRSLPGAHAMCSVCRPLAGCSSCCKVIKSGSIQGALHAYPFHLSERDRRSALGDGEWSAYPLIILTTSVTCDELHGDEPVTFLKKAVGWQCGRHARPVVAGNGGGAVIAL